ncbi:DUF6886 family protein [Paenibacillus hodogayensis]|uniref:DUF6886 family protein n=1 Tax=Paenibacillus hodogayensis TaxID=279208 RepID=A0ABV5W7Z6_9BACL
MELFHFSEEPDIEVFRPRQAPAFPELPPVVFALDRERSPHYYFPRDCPRVIYWKNERTTRQDELAFLSHSAAGKVVAVENGWLDRIRQTKLYRYAFPAAGFRMLDGSAGYYVSTDVVKPLRVEPVGDLLALLLVERVELRFTPSLHPLRDRVIASTLDFSIIRFRNAAKP